jgi:hypothetical protein
MIIEFDNSDVVTAYSYLNQLPDPFVSEKKKGKKSYIKNTLDFYSNKAILAYKKNKDPRKGFTSNYSLLKGIVDYKDYFDQHPEDKSFADMLIGDETLPDYVKHYSMLNPPLSTMQGELSKRPDSRRVKAMDGDSQNAELAFRTQLMQQFIIQEAKQRAIQKMVQQGQDPSQLSEEDLQKLTMEDIQDQLEDYTSTGEKWGNHCLAANKVRFNMKEKNEDGFRDLLIASREFYHVYEDNSSTGFNVDVVNPKNYWKFSTPDKKWSKDFYAQGLIEVMEISEIIEKFPQVTLDEIDHLRKKVQEDSLHVRSNFDSNLSGPSSIIYDTYDRYLEEQKMVLESELFEDSYSDLPDIINQSNTSLGNVGYNYLVVTAYYWGKRLIGNLTYQDEKGNIQTTLVDENYNEGDHPGEVDITWGWINQLYKGVKIGDDVYHLDKFDLLPYMPIIGMIHEGKNTEARSLVDLMKPYQILFNICMNKVWQLMEIEIGNIGVTNIRKIPSLKEGDDRDAMDMHNQIMRQEGMAYEDDSPENTKAPTSNTSIMRAVNLSRTQEIEEKIRTAQALRMECWQMIGMNQQRLGQSQASATASSNQNDLYQSFNQTEPYFQAHDYLMLQVDQAMLDAALHVERKKPESTLSYINTEGEAAFIQVSGEDLLGDMQIFMTSRPEDIQTFQEMKALVQPMMQNGGAIDEALQVMSTNSIREIRKIAKRMEEKRDEQYQQQQGIEQQKLEQDGQLKQAALQQAESHFQQEQALKKYITDTNNQTQIAKAEISTYFQAPATDGDGNGQPDIVDIANATTKAQEVFAKLDIEKQNISLAYQQMQNENKQKDEDRKVTRDQMANDIAVEKLKIKNKPKPKPAKKK